MAVYNPTGSGNVHVDRVISGGSRMAQGMGFQAAAKAVAKKSGKPMKQAKAIIAAGARKASPAAKKANPNLKKVKGATKYAESAVKVAKPAKKKGMAGGAGMC